MLDKHLKEYTKDEHAALEKTFLEVIKGVSSREDYARFLMKLHGYYQAVENKLSPHLEKSNIHDFAQRRKAAQLVADFREVSGNEPVSSLCDQIPPVTSYFSALGVMYVLEGSTLGGQVVASIISRKLKAELGLSFFTYYGSLTMQMWERFKIFLQQPFTSDQQAEVVSAARQTFITFNQWLEVDD